MINEKVRSSTIDISRLISRIFNDFLKMAVRCENRRSGSFMSLMYNDGEYIVSRSISTIFSLFEKYEIDAELIVPGNISETIQ